MQINICLIRVPKHRNHNIRFFETHLFGERLQPGSCKIFDRRFHFSSRYLTKQMSVFCCNDLFKVFTPPLKRAAQSNLVVHDRLIGLTKLSQTLAQSRVDTSFKRSGSRDPAKQMKRLSRSI